jgi:serine/threonine protein kinase
VLKVFKKGTFLKHFQSRMPQGFLQVRVEQIENGNSPTPKLFPKLSSSVLCGTLLKDGRSAFLMEKDHFDLRDLIECNMKSTIGEDCGPFLKDEVECIMYRVALGVDWLHRHDIVYRDLKASNVLVEELKILGQSGSVM